MIFVWNGLRIVGVVGEEGLCKKTIGKERVRLGEEGNLKGSVSGIFRLTVFGTRNGEIRGKKNKGDLAAGGFKERKSGG